MALSAKRYTITAALPYTNGPITHRALSRVSMCQQIFTVVICALKRKMLLLFVGSDEHGVAISIKAKKEGVTPKEIIDKYDGMIRKSFVQLGISFDNLLQNIGKDSSRKLLQKFLLK